MGWLLVGLASFLAAQSVSALELDHAEYARQSGRTPPAEADWTPVRLPDLWSENHPGYGGDIWYRLHFKLDEVPQEEYAVFLPRLCMNASVRLNGVHLGSGGRFEDPVSRNWNRPLLFLAPPALLRAGDNLLEVRLHSPAYSLGSLSPVSVGPDRELRPRYEALFFTRITLNQTATLIITAMGLFMLALWWQRRQDTMYGLFGLSSLVWAFNSSNMFIQNIPVPAPLWETLIQGSFQVFISLLMISLLRFLGLRRPWLERLLWAVLAASPLSLLLLPDDWLASASLLWHLVTLLSSVWVGALLLRQNFRTADLDITLLTGALGLNIIFGFHDWLMYASIVEHGGTYWIHYGGPVFFLVVGGILTRRFVQALNQYEHLNTDLEQRVRAKHAELESQFATTQSIVKQRAMLEERNRIYRDLHDDMGAKLLGLAISAERANLGKEADLARSALQDLRDVVSRSTHVATPLSDLLADWRMETEQRVRAAGLLLGWQFPERNSEIMVSPEAALNMSRILREAVTNVLRHARASSIRVDTRLDDDHFALDIEDDGIGLPPQLAPHRGMSSMQARAAALGATLEWQPQEPGCRVTLRVPLEQLAGQVVRHEPAL
ncbi:sensor histidine kinase [Sideroxyarcus sp. TK5]